MNSFTTILQTLAELHETLLATAKKKQQILISSEMNPLLTVLAEESKLIKKIQEEDQKRLALLGEEGYKASLSELIEREPEGEQKQEWNVIFQKLQQVFVELEQVNHTNQQLIQQSLTFTNYMMEQMLPKAAQTGVYNTKADSKEARESVRFFDAKA